MIIIKNNRVEIINGAVKYKSRRWRLSFFNHLKKNLSKVSQTVKISFILNEIKIEKKIYKYLGSYEYDGRIGRL